MARVCFVNGDHVSYIIIELREFFPQTICERADNVVDIRVVSGSEIIFNDCLSSFLNYSREIAHMREVSRFRRSGQHSVHEESRTYRQSRHCYRYRERICQMMPL